MNLFFFKYIHLKVMKFQFQAIISLKTKCQKKKCFKTHLKLDVSYPNDAEELNPVSLSQNGTDSSKPRNLAKPSGFMHWPSPPPRSIPKCKHKFWSLYKPKVPPPKIICKQLDHIHSLKLILVINLSNQNDVVYTR